MAYERFSPDEIRQMFTERTEVRVLQVGEDGDLYRKLIIAFPDFRRENITTLSFPEKLPA